MATRTLHRGPAAGKSPDKECGAALARPSGHTIMQTQLLLKVFPIVRAEEPCETSPPRPRFYDLTEKLMDKKGHRDRTARRVTGLFVTRSRYIVSLRM